MTKKEIEFDELYKLPNGWEWSPLEKLLVTPKQDMVDGPFGSNLKASEYTDEGIPIARLQNIDRNQFVYKNIKFITQEKAEYLDRHNFKPGDILVTKLGAPLGKACLAPDMIKHGVIVADVVRVRVEENAVDRKYITYALNSPFLVKQFKNHTKGTTRPRVNLGIMRNLPIPVAPIEQQKRIVAEIEKQFSRLDEAVANLKRVKANLKRYKAAVLKAAVEGKLTEKWREEQAAKLEAQGSANAAGDTTSGAALETAEELLKRILAERRQKWEEAELAKMKAKGKLPKDDKWKKKYKDPAPPDTSDLDGLPEGWVWVTTSQLLKEVKDGTHDTPKYYESGVPFITQKHVKAAGFVFDNFKRISSEDHEHFFKRSNPEKGDILVSMIGVNRGESCIVDTDEVFSIKNVGLFKPDHKRCDVKYIQYYLSSSTGQHLLLRWSKGGAQPFVGLNELRNWPIPISPLEEQRKIAKEVERFLSFAHEIETQVYTSFNRTERLRQSILSKAFSGQLVQPEPGDEPASILLERIKEGQLEQAQRRKSPKKTKRRKMVKVSTESIREVVEQFPSDTFTFEQLRDKVATDYDTLKELVFTLLGSENPPFTQAFDESSRQIQFVRVKK